MKKLYYLFLFIISTGFISCGGGDDEPTPAPKTPPGAFNITTPVNSQECVEDQAGKIEIKWTSSENADKYKVHIKKGANYVAGYPKTISSGTSHLATLDRSTRYNMFVVAKNNDGEKNADSIEFSTEGYSISNEGPRVMNESFDDATGKITFSIDNPEDETVEYVIKYSDTDDFSGADSYGEATLNPSDFSGIESLVLPTTPGVAFWINFYLKDENGSITSYTRSYYYE